MEIKTFTEFSNTTEKKMNLPDLGETISFTGDVKVGKKTFDANTEFEVTDANDSSVQITKGKDSAYFTLGELTALDFYLV